MLLGVALLYVFSIFFIVVLLYFVSSAGSMSYYFLVVSEYGLFFFKTNKTREFYKKFLTTFVFLYTQ